MTTIVRDAKIYNDLISDKILIGYETKETQMNFDVTEISGGSNKLCFSLATDKWFVDTPKSPQAMKKRRIDIYMALTQAQNLLEKIHQISLKYPAIKKRDCPSFSSGFYPSGMESGQKMLPDGFNCFRSTVIEASLNLKELQLIAKPDNANLFIDYEKNHRTHLLQFEEPALHFALSSKNWNVVKDSVKRNNLDIIVDIKCIKSIEECVSRIIMNG